MNQNQLLTPITKQTRKSPLPTTSLNLWTVYGICLLISTVFFFLFGFNSPIYTYNSDHDFNWFITVGRSLLAGKIPYRDVFEQKGPIVYFITAFCCLFQNYNLAVLILEIICMSLFFFFAYRIAKKRLNTFYSLCVVSVLALTVFTSWCRMRSGDALEEFCLPIYAYFLLCWLEFLIEKRDFNWVRALCLGLCFGIILWVKYTLVYFMLVPMLIWLTLNVITHKYSILIKNIAIMLIGIITITIPIIVFYIVNDALTDLLHVYFVINLTAYGNTSLASLLKTFRYFFLIGPLPLIFMFWGVARFTIRRWHERNGWLLLIAFLINWILLIFSAKGIIYYFIGLFPYTILGCIDIMTWIQEKLTLQHHHKLFYTIITISCLIICIPFSILVHEWGRTKDEYAPLVIADIIHDYETTNNTEVSLYCYRTGDFGFYNTTGIIPNNYYFCNNYFSIDNYPEMFASMHDYIVNQTSDFVITTLVHWDDEKDFLSQYYQLYSDTIYHYHQLHYFYYVDYDFVLLIKKS